MTNETKHTPTPWKIENWHGDTQIVGPEGSLICIDTTYYPVAPSEEDMAHIVKCVNMHDELVRQRDILLEGLETVAEYDTGSTAGLAFTAKQYLKKAGAL